MSNENVTVSATVKASAETVFAVLADPRTHAAIDGTGWVREPFDGDHLTEVGQVFQVAMYHEGHPNKDYEIANTVRVIDPPRTICWEPGTYEEDGTLSHGGWTWRYDLAPTDESTTEVTLTYDWSQASAQAREFIQFPPFAVEHLHNSLAHLADLAAARHSTVTA
jgi:hypothetical protein